MRSMTPTDDDYDGTRRRVRNTDAERRSIGEGRDERSRKPPPQISKISHGLDDADMFGLKVGGGRDSRTKGGEVGGV